MYPGFLQLTSFVSMNLDRHLSAHRELYQHLVDGDEHAADDHPAFYDEYFAVLDLTAEFYLETVQYVFQEHRLARGVLEFQGRRVDPGAIRRTALLTVEGERDDICSPGQTFAAHDLCSSIKPMRKRHHLQPGVGHYGVFSGRRWEHADLPAGAQPDPGQRPERRRLRARRAGSPSAVLAGFSSQMMWSSGMSPRSTARFITRTTMAQ